MNEIVDVDAKREANGSADISSPKSRKRKKAPHVTSSSETNDGLTSTNESPSVNKTESMGQGVRWFFPCNREDALVLLGGLSISHLFPDKTIRLAIQQEGVAVIEDGIRLAEEILLHGGREEKFPLLVELAPSVLSSEPRIVEYGHVVGLRFRSVKEAEEFRFRPVDEFDTEEFSCTAEPNLFDREGGARFSIRETLDGQWLGRAADRMTAGVLDLLELGTSRPECRDAIADIMTAGPRDASRDEFSVTDVLKVLSGSGEGVARHARAISSAFFNTEKANPGLLVENVSKALSESETTDPRIARMESKWIEVAHDIIRNRAVLDGAHLSDSGSIALRSALLASVLDDPDAVATFLDAEKPSGIVVTTAAAFLTGLKRGLIDTPWNVKKARSRELSKLCALILRKLLANDSLAEIFSVIRERAGQAERIAIRFDGTLVAEWEVKQRVPLDEVARKWLADFSRHGLEVLGYGPSQYSWQVRLSGQLQVELTRKEAGVCEPLRLKYVVGENENIRKPKELLEILAEGSVFWYPALGAGGDLFLYCDLLSVPDTNQQKFIMQKLERMIEASVVKKKNAKRRRTNKRSPSE